MPLVGQDGGAGGFAGGRAEKVFRELHLVAVRPVRAVELHHRELGVVTDGDAFVAEVAVDFEDALEAAHDEALQICLLYTSILEGILIKWLDERD